MRVGIGASVRAERAGVNPETGLVVEWAVPKRAKKDRNRSFYRKIADMVEVGGPQVPKEASMPGQS
jgi:hypothetical protein